jgi:hypothetical protein
MAMTDPLTASTRAAFLRRVALWQPRERGDAEAALDLLIDWSHKQHPALVALPAGEQDTVAFGVSTEPVVWRAYPSKTERTKVVAIPGFRKTLAHGSAALVREFEAAIPGMKVGDKGHLQVPLGYIADSERFADYCRFLDVALATLRAHVR